MTKKFYINCPYDEKDLAKTLGEAQIDVEKTRTEIEKFVLENPSFSQNVMMSLEIEPSLGIGKDTGLQISEIGELRTINQ